MAKQDQRINRDLLKFDKTVMRTFDSFEEADEADREHWLSCTPEERMIALEHIRQLAWGYNDQSGLKLSRSPGLLKLSRRPLSGGRRIRG